MPRVDGRPLSRRQMMIWAGQKFDPGVPLYNMTRTFSIPRAVDVAAFRSAFQVLIDSCDALRIVVSEIDGSPWQSALERLPFDLPFIDLSDEQDPDAELHRWVQQHGRQEFDLSQQLFDAALIKTGPATFHWYLNQHHLIADAWSASLLLRYQGELYELACDGDLRRAPSRPSYFDAFDAEDELLRSDAHQESLDYWRDRLDVDPEPLTFYDTRPADAGLETLRVEVGIDGARAVKLAEFLGRSQIATISPELTVLRVFQTVLLTLLHRVTGSQHLVLGTPFHNRQSAVAKETVGLFMNLCPVGVAVDPGETMTTLMNKVGRETFEGLRHARFPLDPTVEAAAFEVVLNYIHAPFVEFAGLPSASEWVHCGFGDRGHSLRLQVLAGTNPGEFRLLFDLKTGLFDERGQGFVAAHFLRVLDAWLEHPEVAVSDIALTSDEDRAGFLAEVDPLEPGPTGATTVLEDFARQVQVAPGAVAIRSGSQVLTYVELDAASDRFAGILRRAGVVPGDVVALLLNRSTAAIVALLATLKTRASYLPIDNGTPPARIAETLADASASLLVTENELIDRCPANRPPTIVVDADVSEQRSPDEGPHDLAATAPQADDVAYIIYTSGSTGKPKGVPIDHRRLANYVTWARSEYCGDDSKDFAWFTSLAFDLTVTSIFVPLVAGGAIVVYEEDSADNEPAVVRVFREGRVDVVKATPSHLSAVRTIDVDTTRLGLLIVGGEDFKTALAVDVHAQFGGGVTIVNEYGPTEATVACTLHRFDPTLDDRPSVPIGRAIANAEIYVLDGYGQLVPPGVVGEIHIGGPGVAQGYLSRPELTAERFIEPPATLRTTIDREAVALLYRTGDRARWIDCGTEPVLEYLGRIDNQVKVRGHRVELGELEAAMLDHPDVLEAVASVISDSIGGSAAPEPMSGQECLRCGLPTNFPNVTFVAGVCSLCRDYDTYRDKVDAYFRDIDQLRALATTIKTESARRDQQYDCMVLLSGGKDSTYMLYQVAALGLRPLVFTLDNGYISEQAKDNCRRVTDHLGFDLILGTTPHMNEIFRDSLDRFSNVCHGCFKTIYTLSINIARQHEIGHIFTGLARGQLFETRLSDMYSHKIFDADQIDEYVLEARKAYHRLDDAVSEHLDVEVLQDGAVFDEIEFVDYYRYTDVELDEMLRYLRTETPWARPSDTGRSTNCLINDVGIYVHKKERGFHNYAFPYSWDVRLGHKQRDAALEELDDDIDEAYVSEVLVELGYKPKEPAALQLTSRLVVYYRTATELDPVEARRFLAERLPEHMMPSQFVRLDTFPLARSGKVDRRALPAPGRAAGLQADVAAAHQKAADRLHRIWIDIFGRDEIAIGDNFFDLGGDSIIAIQIIARAADAGLMLQPRQLFDHQTIAELAAVATPTDRTGVQAEQGLVVGPVPLTPVQAHFFELEHPIPKHWNQMVRLRCRGPIDADSLEAALAAIVVHHDALRTKFVRDPASGEWSAGLSDVVPDVAVIRLDLDGVFEPTRGVRLDRAINDLNEGFDLASGRLLGALLVTPSDDSPASLYIAAHHLVVDGLSWFPILADLETAYEQLHAGDRVELPAKTASYRQWADSLVEDSTSGSNVVVAALDHWTTDGTEPASASRPRTQTGDDPALRRGASSVVSAELDHARTTLLLRQAHNAYRTEIDELLLTTLARTLRSWSGGSSVLVDVEGHGRDPLGSPIDVSRTVGWFTTIAPFALTVSGSAEIGDDITTIKEQVRATKRHGTAFGMLRYLSPDPTVRAGLASRPSSPVLFNYLGQLDQVTARLNTFELMHEAMLSCAPACFQEHELEFNARVAGGVFSLLVTYNDERTTRAVAETLAESFVDELAAIIDHCVGGNIGGYTPSDFALAGLDQSGLDQLAALLGD